jgi:uncharacterized protein YeaO (DUF488 family)
MPVRTKHVSERATESDGTRVLVDRLWPRGRTKASAPLDQWCRESAPSTELRQWFGHDPAKWVEFQRRYRRELAANRTAVSELRALAKAGNAHSLGRVFRGPLPQLAGQFGGQVPGDRSRAMNSGSSDAR